MRHVMGQLIWTEYFEITERKRFALMTWEWPSKPTFTFTRGTIPVVHARKKAWCGRRDGVVVITIFGQKVTLYRFAR